MGRVSYYKNEQWWRDKTVSNYHNADETQSVQWQNMATRIFCKVNPGGHVVRQLWRSLVKLFFSYHPENKMSSTHIPVLACMHPLKYKLKYKSALGGSEFDGETCLVLYIAYSLKTEYLLQTTRITNSILPMQDICTKLLLMCNKNILKYMGILNNSTF